MPASSPGHPQPSPAAAGRMHTTDTNKPGTRWPGPLALPATAPAPPRPPDSSASTQNAKELAGLACHIRRFGPFWLHLGEWGDGACYYNPASGVALAPRLMRPNV